MSVVNSRRLLGTGDAAVVAFDVVFIDVVFNVVFITDSVCMNSVVAGTVAAFIIKCTIVVAFIVFVINNPIHTFADDVTNDVTNDVAVARRRRQRNRFVRRTSGRYFR